MSIPIAEFVLGAMLHHAKNVPALLDAQSRRSWEPPMHLELRGKTVLVVGVGSIGGRVAGLCQAFGMRVLGVKRDSAAHDAVDEMHPPSALHELLPRADFVVLSTPSTPETDGMIGAAQLAAMKPSAYLINVARGSLLDDDALINALNRGIIGGACLDAYDEEPLPSSSPLWTAPNLLLSPHASYRTPEIRDRVIAEFEANLRRRLRGETLVGTMRHVHLGY
jgi:phosphoglycerate dehydrogenase-like enzyme